MLKKFLVMSCLISFCSGIGINAAETSKSQGCSFPKLAISNVASFTIGALAGHVGTKQFDGNEEKIKKLESENAELKKNIVDKTQLEDLKKEVSKLQSDNDRLNAELKSLTDIWGTDLNLNNMKKAKKLYDWSVASSGTPGSYYNLMGESHKRLESLFQPLNKANPHGDTSKGLVRECFGMFDRSEEHLSNYYNSFMNENVTNDERKKIFGGLLFELKQRYKDFKFAIKGK